MGTLRQAIPVQFKSWKNFVQWLRNIAVAFDQLVGSVVYAGDPDETISSVIGKRAELIRQRQRIYSNRRLSYADWFIILMEKLVDFMLGKDHCIKAIEDEEGGDGLF